MDNYVFETYSKLKKWQNSSTKNSKKIIKETEKQNHIDNLVNKVVRCSIIYFIKLKLELRERKREERKNKAKCCQRKKNI